MASRPALSSPSSSITHKPKKRKLQRVRVAGILQALGNLTPALPPTLPSPPTHRSASSCARSKRKLEDAPVDEPHPKKPRTTPATSQPAPSRPPVPPFPQSRSTTQVSAPPAPAPSEHSEDGEVREELPMYRNSMAVVSNVPVRRPRRRQVPASYWQDLYTKYQAEGVRLKYSGSARLRASYPSTDFRFKALPDPPQAGTTYHKFGHLMARLELLDALLCFTYALWCIDISDGTCHRQNWPLILNLVSQSKTQWRGDDGEDWERAFHGLICLIEAFINGRKWRFALPGTLTESNRLVRLLHIHQDAEDDARRHKEQEELAKRQASMLPSPASSAGSTPNSVGGTPNGALAAPASAPTTDRQAAPSEPALQQPQSRKESPINTKHEVRVNVSVVGPYRSQAFALDMARKAADTAGRMVTLPIMAKHFPRTFARMTYSSLSTTDEHEPDFDDDEGELFWPGQVCGSDGLGWVCYMGRAMVREYTQQYGYRGIEGALPLPEGYAHADDPRHFPPPPTVPAPPAPAPAR